MIEKLTLDDFTQLRDRDLTVRFGDTEQAARVVDARQTAGGRPGGRASFAVTLRSGPPEKFWPQGTHTLVHPEYGDLALFMVPIGPDEEGMLYEISFS